MKTKIDFLSNTSNVIIIVADKDVQTLRKLITKDDAEIIEEFSSEIRRDGRTAFVIDNMNYQSVMLCLKQPEVFFVAHYTAKFSSDIKVKFSIEEQSRLVNNIRISARGENRKDDQENWHEYVTIYSEKPILREIEGYKVGWPSIGSVSTDVAITFATCLNTAVTLMMECEAQLKTNKASA